MNKQFTTVMTKKIATLMGLALTSLVMNAQLLQDVSTSTTAIVRDPARQASTEIDAVINNPAGTAFLNEGWHFSLNGHVGTQTIDLNVGDLTTHRSMMDFIPSFQTAYKKSQFAVSFSYANEGGYGIDYNQELDPLMTYCLNRVCNNESFDNYKNVMSEFTNSCNVSDKLYNEATVKSTLYNHTFRAGISFSFTPHFSVYGGVRINKVSETSDLYVYRTIEKSNIQRVTPYDYFTAINNEFNNEMDKTIKTSEDINNEALVIAQIAEGLGLDASDLTNRVDESKVLLETLKMVQNEISKKNNEMAGTPSWTNIKYASLDGWGITPVIGVDYKIDNFNFAAKYEFDTKIRTNDSYSSFHIPSLLTVGTSWKVNNNVTLSLGGSWTHINMDKSYFADNSVTISDNDMIFNLGTYESKYSFDCSKSKDFFSVDASISIIPVERLTLSLGYSCAEQGYLCKSLFPKSTPFSTNSISHAFLGGLSYEINNHFTFDFGISKKTQPLMHYSTQIINSTNHNSLTFSAGINVNI